MISEYVTYVIIFILVEKLATNAQGVSNYSYTENIDHTYTATLDTKLTLLGINIGEDGTRLGVTVNGIERGVNLTQNDTIGSFLNKMKGIGVEGDYNESTGILCLNLSVDKDGTSSYAKFSAMDILIGKFQKQYTNFLS